MGSRAAYSDLVNTLFKGSRRKQYPKNQLVQYQGDPLSEIFHIEKGYVKTYTILDSGDTRTIFILGPGDIFPIAFSTTLDWENYKLKYFYQCMTDIEVSTMSSAEFKKIIEKDPVKKNIYMTYMTASNNAIMNQLEAMKQKKAITRIIYMLPYLIRKMGRQVKPGAYQLKVKLTHQELADLSGVTRETTTTLVKKLEKKGAIDQKKGNMIINKKSLDKLTDE